MSDQIYDVKIADESAGVRRKQPVGAEVSAEGVHFRVWAPARKKIEVVFEDKDVAPHSLEPDEQAGYFSGLVAQAKAGARYRFRLDGASQLLPDPASRFQPEGPHGPSQVVDPRKFGWSDASWPGIRLPGQVLYELHVGTFTREGTWEAAARELPRLAEDGITVVEMMPVAEFPGRFGWGYDGVDLFAPAHVYGTPDDLRRFVDRAHACGVGVILDVVYNHFGPDGNYLGEFSPHYFTSSYKNEWGEAINFDGANSGPVREMFIANAAYWIDEFHFDGLRLDATQQIFDASETNILTEIGAAVRRAANGRETIIVAENEPQHTALVRPVEHGGFGLDGLWNDDFHHSAHVALTGHCAAYYSDHCGLPQEFVSAAKYGYLFQGQTYSWQKQRRGMPSFDLPAAAFINFLENHDQVANSATGERLHRLTSPGRYRAMTAFTLLMPGTPMLFQGQEFGSSARWVYFADHPTELARKVREGRAEFLKQFPNIALEEVAARVADPGDLKTFESCKLDFSEREKNVATYDLHRDLLRLRRDDAVLRLNERGRIDGAVLSPQCFLLRYFGDGMDHRLLIVNLGPDLDLRRAPEPLLAPPSLPQSPRGANESCVNRRWKILWSSEDLRYGGCGTPDLDTESGWRIPGESAVVLGPAPLE